MLHASNPTTVPDPHDVRSTVRQGYGAIAVHTGSGCCGTGTKDATVPLMIDRAVRTAESLGYQRDDVAALPEGANMGLSCGNPGAIAALSAGELVLDLGSGGGFDVFLAGPRVGATGRVIGVDMTPQMIDKARAGVAHYRQRTGLNNVEFRLGEIEHLPVADASVDVVLSNCVINLSPDKPAVWREIARVLRPGGRVAVSDVALLRPLPAAVRSMVEALVGCVAGAVTVDEYREAVEAAGLTNVTLTPKPHFMDGLCAGNDSLLASIVEHLPAGTGPKDFITSLDVMARKPGGAVSLATLATVAASKEAGCGCGPTCCS